MQQRRRRAREQTASAAHGARAPFLSQSIAAPFSDHYFVPIAGYAQQHEPYMSLR